MQAMDRVGRTAWSNACDTCHGHMLPKRDLHARAVAVMPFARDGENARCTVDGRLCLRRPWHARLARRTVDGKLCLYRPWHAGLAALEPILRALVLQNEKRHLSHLD